MASTCTLGYCLQILLHMLGQTSETRAKVQQRSRLRGRVKEARDKSQEVQIIHLSWRPDEEIMGTEIDHRGLPRHSLPIRAQWMHPSFTNPSLRGQHNTPVLQHSPWPRGMPQPPNSPFSIFEVLSKTHCFQLGGVLAYIDIFWNLLGERPMVYMSCLVGGSSVQAGSA